MIGKIITHEIFLCGKSFFVAYHFLMQMQSLRRELSSGVQPLHETFVALVRIFAKKGLSTRGMEILAAMERYKYDIRKAWLILVGMEIDLCFIFGYWEDYSSFHDLKQRN